MKETSWYSFGLRLISAATAIVALLLVRAALGQTPGTSAISGIVYDPANHVVAKADVLVINEATQASRSTTTTPEGVFRAPLLLPGDYTVTVKALGFAPSATRSVQVTASETVSLNIVLTVADVGTTVQVSGRTQLADLESSTLGSPVFRF